MPDLYIDTLTKDLVILNGTFKQGTLAQDVAQRVTDTLSTFIGEWFIDTTYGALTQNIFQQKNPSLSIIEAQFKAAILNAAQSQLPANMVAVLTDFSMSLNTANRNLTISCNLAVGTLIIPIQVTTPS